MPITDWPLAERPREKLMARGAHALSDAELLAIFIGSGVRGRTALDLARDILARFGGLRALLSAKKDAVCDCAGLGEARFVALQAALEIGRRHLDESLRRGEIFSTADDTKRYLQARLRDREQEVFCCMFLDNRHRLLAFEELFIGTFNGAAVYPREVVKRALSHNAAATIFAHNHPSGVAEPSTADRQLTRRLQDALGLIDVRVLDHLVVGDGGTVSFSELGYL